MTDWSVYRKCPVCFAELGEACTTITGALIHGHPYPQVDPVRSNRDRPHSRRKLRTGAVA